MALPRRERPEVDLTSRYLRPGRAGQLRPVQSWALLELEEYGGLFGPIGVGEGKTLILMLAPTAMVAKKPLMLVPASVYAQVIQMYAAYRQDWLVGEMKFLTYEKLSRPESAEFLLEYMPDVILADECHLLKHMTSARTKRVIRYLLQFHAAFVAVSGTVTRRSLLDYAHLAALALDDLSPVPREKYALEAWARLIDADGKYMGSDWQYVEAFKEVPGMFAMNQESLRVAFGHRFRETPGVVATSDVEVGASLRIRTERDVPYPQELYEQVRDSKTRPDGELLIDDVDVWRCLRELSLGFYYVWDWGDRDPDEEWLWARSRWNREVAYEIGRTSEWGLDSKKLIELAVRDGRLKRPELKKALFLWDEVSDREPPDTVPVWVSSATITYLVGLAKEIMRAGHRPIIWYASLAVADALAQRNVSVCRAGESPPAEYGGIVALSIESHGKGWNLQAYDASLVLEPMASGEPWEQLIGRTHRQGQQSDTVRVWIAQHTEIYRRCLRNARRDAKYVEQTTGMTQRLCYADWVEEGK